MNLKRTISFLACILILTAAYAIPLRGKDGKAVPGTDHDNPALWQAPRAQFTRSAAPGAYSTQGIPFGKREYLVVLVEFPDRKFFIDDNAKLVSKYTDLLNKTGYHDAVLYKGSTYQIDGSVKDYFLDQSFGKFEPSFKVIGPYTLQNRHNFYGNNSAGPGTDSESVKKLVKEVCDMIGDTVDLGKYAESGTVQLLSIIYAGQGENFGDAEKDAIWPQADNISLSGKNVKGANYLCTCELFWDSDNIIDGIGTFCHEFSHTLGLPDYYFTNSTNENVYNASMGYWSIMDYGSYENLGFSPVGYTAFERYSLGWMNLTEITESGTYTLDELTSDNPVAYRLTAGTGSDDRFLILENHQQKGWYKYQKSKGLMVTSVAFDYNSWVGNYVNAAASRRRYCILPADNERDRDGGEGDLFPYGTMDSITWYSLPQFAVAYMTDISKPAFSIYDISDRNGTVSFYAGTQRPTAVEGQATDIPISVFDLSGRLRMTVSDESDIPSGLWIIRKGNETKKVKR